MKCDCDWTYWPLVRFFLPLTATYIAVNIAEQALNRGVTTGQDAVAFLAVFGIAYTVIKFANGTLLEFKHVGVVLVHSRQDNLKGLVSVLGIAGIIFSLAAAVAYSKLGFYVVNKLYGLNDEVGMATRKCIFYMSIYPLLDGTAQLQSGVLLQHKHSTLVAASCLVDVGLQIASIVGLLQSNLATTQPLLIPVIALYTGTSAKLLVVLSGYFKFVFPKLPNTVSTTDGMRLTIPKILWFWWPLALVRGIQILSRPICNVLVAQDLSSDEALQAIAILTVVYPVGQVCYQWLNDLKPIVPTFLKGQSIQTRHGITPKHIIIFNTVCTLCSFLFMVIVFWIPGVTVLFLTNVLKLDHSMAEKCIVPLRIFSFMPFPVALRAHSTSWLMLWQQTRVIAPSAVIRLGVLIVALVTLPHLGVHGAPLGIAALLSSFWGETLTVLAGTGLIRYKRRKKRDSDNGDSSSSNDSARVHESLMVEEKETTL
ncbi:progressive ankylosis protein homolog B-like [Glandiceps talaboti]